MQYQIEFAKKNCFIPDYLNKYKKSDAWIEICDQYI